MRSTYIELIGTVVSISSQHNRHVIQLIMGEPNDVINDTRSLCMKDVIKIEIEQAELPKLGDRVHIQGTATISPQQVLKINTKQPTELKTA